MNPQPSWEELQPYYNTNYAPYKRTNELEDDESALREARKTGQLRHIPLPTAKRLLDLGCGAGSFLRLAKKLGSIEQGVEPSKYAASVAQKQGLNVFCGTLEQFAAANPGAKYDIITANHVVEHLPDPVATLRTMKALLADEGTIWISVPNAAYPICRALNGLWHSTDLPYHLMQFSPASMARAGTLAGLTVSKQKTESIPHIVEASIGQYLRYRWMIPRRVSGRLGFLRPLAAAYARKMDNQNRGEAIITEFQCGGASD
ncbi:class I SAM-dependent methyltransferase [Bradyrhizobium sp. CCBAU 11434]|uniref:class I SAM-dependent methyltransferase n=1 Tax=Bradyrhizobium sp. CCBAU 11434 TaxID=1630885 RepID=UPI002305B729|nr:class I SAM-dependent methyltransferase [Bradyrhizobium sp. CCBAU 11434]